MVASEGAELLLDAAIRDYVLLPILFVMFSVTLIRHALTLAFQSQPTRDLKAAYDAQILMRSRRWLANGSRLGKDAFEQRRAYFIHKDNGLLTIKAKPPTDKADLGIPGLPMIDPTKMMQGQTSMIFNNLYVVMLYNVIDHVFSGFVAAKLPLSLTGGFKRMLHFGIDLENMEVTYVSSSSWYLLIFSGLQQVTTVILGAAAVPSMVPSTATQVAPIATGGADGAPGMFGSEPHKQFDSEIKIVANHVHTSIIEESPARLEKRR